MHISFRRVLFLPLFVATFFPSVMRAQNELGNGTPVSGALTASANTISYTFSANAGDYFLGDITEISPPNAAYAIYKILNPDGSSSPYSNISSWTYFAPTQTGTHTIVVTRSDGGTYGGTVNFSLTMALAPEAYTVPSGQPGGVLTNGLSYSNSLPLGEIDQYTLRLKAGDFLAFGVNSTSSVGGGTVIKIINPDGSALYSGSVYSTYSVHVSQTGDYRVWAVRSDTNAGTANYTFTIANAPEAFVPADDGGDMVSGGSYGGSLPGWGDVDQWTFNATSGQPIALNLTFSGSTGGVANFFLMRPDGTAQTTGAMTSYSGTAKQTGAYQAIVFRNESGETASNDNVSYTIGLTTGGTPSAPSPSGTEIGDLSSCDSCKTMALANGDPTSNQPAAGDPINVATGNLYEKVVDYTTAGANPLAFIRYYNSMAYVASSPIAHTLGVNWRSNYDRFIAIKSSSNVLVERPDGRIVAFSLSGSNWVSNSDLDMTLTNSGSTWVFTDVDDTVETYADVSASMAAVSSIRARNGYTQTMSYSGGLLSGVTDSYGRTLSFTHTDGLLNTLTTPDSLVLTYGLTSVTPGYGYERGVAQNLLTSVAYNTSPASSLTYLYENTGFPFSLTGITDENGNRYATWVYDSQGRATSSELGGGADYTQIAYDDSTGNRTVTGPLGQQMTYKYTLLNNVHKISEVDRHANAPVAAGTRTYGYDANGYMNQVVDWNGNITTYTNNAHGLPTTMVEASGSSVARTTTIVYDPSWVHLPHTVTTTGLTTTFNYEAGTGNLLTKALTDTTATAGTYAAATRTWTYTWSNYLLASIQNPRTDLNATTHFGYDSTGALTSFTNAKSQITHITAHTGGGRPTTMVDPNGVTTTMTYSPRQWLLTSSVATAGGAATTMFGYDAAGDVISRRAPDGVTYKSAYDAAHRLTTITEPLGDIASYTLNAMGEATAWAYEYSSGSHRKSHTSSYDAVGRLITDTGGQSQQTQYAYDGNGNPTTVTDPKKHATGQVFDALNRLHQITDRANGVTTTTYDVHDRPLTVTTPNGATTTYTYDGFGEVGRLSSPDSGVTTYHYDGAGNLTSKTDALSVVANYTYDALSRRLTASYPADTKQNVAYSYDQTGHGDGIGRLTSLTDPAGSESRSYDERGNLTSATRTHGTVNLKTGYTYNLASRPGSITYPDGMSVATAYDGNGRPHGMTLKPSASGAQQTILSGITYQPFLDVSSYLAYGNGITETRTYDADYRPYNVYVGSLISLYYAYDANDNPTQIKDNLVSGNTQNLTYDTLDRLLTASGAYGNESFGYDGNGNRTTAGSTSWTYTPNTNRLTAMGTTAVSTNANGNITNIAYTTPTGFIYNKANRLASVTSNGNTVLSYLYDGFGQRVTKTDTATRFEQYDWQGHLIEQTDNTNTVQKDYVYLGDRPVATFVPNGGTGTLSFIFTNRQNTPMMATDASKKIGWSVATDPFGSGTATVGTISNDLRFSGQEYEQATGHNHNGFRDYAPGLGRYLETDPIGLAGGQNSTYAYARSNPARFVDPSGQSDLGTAVRSTVCSFLIFCSPSNPMTAQQVINQEQAQAGQSLEQKVFNFISNLDPEDPNELTEQQQKILNDACPLDDEETDVIPNSRSFFNFFKNMLPGLVDGGTYLIDPFIAPPDFTPVRDQNTGGEII